MDPPRCFHSWQTAVSIRPLNFNKNLLDDPHMVTL